MRTMLITGGSSGIGAATARLAARGGWDVALSFHSDTQAAEATVEAVRARGRRAWAAQADMADPNAIAALFEGAQAELGRLSAFVNNAGIVMPKARFEDITPERLDDIFAVNARGAFLAAQHAVRAMAKRHGGRGGSIVNISSVAALKGGAGEYVDYAATKGALDTMTLGLAQEMSREGVRVNGVRPGIIDTPIHGRGGQHDRIERIAPSVPMGRAGSAEEVAEAILWLASDASRYTTGTFIEVSGGRHI